ncbi:CD2 antigen cytoplasmic tail-binding protein 2-like [Pollicipes pollicipes]|uniref:CD2 antigen cytoplasmic tail-binding protein 2-like n=1 Tax=Pollicipes pollicipes TaxID=41117 RepID=UPI001884CE9B|nr:CD2 antigen cytoplasmic tail-binding protein 2-like [Pollicipes pollicipes]XP_037092768.1 CD2 antigen cytoplasmic tail-binding protein 2-like [Pollicipes pollicipes]
MSKRSHDESEGLDSVVEQPIKKHTLDSDEEDEADSKKYNLMDPEEIEGEEDATMTKDGDIQITPFNMKEEMTEGHFDAEGNYFWKKEVEIRDAWLDNIDDAQQYHDEEQKDGSDDESSDDQGDALKDSDKAAIYEQMLELMEPNESVAKALRRLGGNKARHSAAARWRQKRAAAAGAAEPADAAAGRERMDRLTGLADRLLSAGHMEVYQMTREAAAHQLEQLRRPVADRLQGATEDDALDMFGDSLDQQPAAPAAAAGEPTPDTGGAGPPPATDNGKTAPDNSADQEAGDAVTWEFKWEASEDAEVHGPHTSAEMNAWSESGYFSDAVLVRKTGTAAFYQAKRVDFDLYI